MITFSKLGKHGNLGNQLHQVASLIGFSEKYNCELVLPKWKYSNYFKNLPLQAEVETDFFIEEKYFHYTPEFWDTYSESFKTRHVDVLAFLQSEKYWRHCKEKVHHALRFDDELLKRVKARFEKSLERKTIAISIRRGDFITNPNHYFLPLDYYLQALVNFFPNYREYSIIIFSDEVEYCYLHIKHLSNIFFAKGLTPIEQLSLMSLCDHFIISNSTFSWWGAMLGEKKESIVVRPAYHFQGEWGTLHNSRDYYPDRWKIFDHQHQQTGIKSLKPSILYRTLSYLKRNAYINYKKVVRGVS